MADVKILNRDQHPISRNFIAQPALKVLYRLKSKGFRSFLVGGCLRDFYLKRPPRDFDIVTDAGIDEIRDLFRNSKAVGRRFPIVHTYFGNEVIEVSTLKSAGDFFDYNWLLEDSRQRDFTVNAIYYDINGFKIIDPQDGLKHLQQKRIVPIGDPTEKFLEDPIRMLRALKLTVKQGLVLDDSITRTMENLKVEQIDIGPGRKYEELTRIFLDGQVEELLAVCREHDMFRLLWPQGEGLLQKHGIAYFRHLLATIPVDLARGSYIKQTHLHLWFSLFCSSPFFSPTDPPEAQKAAFEAFLTPLGMPFRNPILETLSLIGGLAKNKDRQPDGVVSREIRRLLQQYLNLFPENPLEEIQHLLQQKNPGRRKNAGDRKRRSHHRGRRGRRRKNPKP